MPKSNSGSGTENLYIVSFMHPDNVHTIYLIDTPGFDDTSRSDGDILAHIAHYLSVSYANSIYIHGIVLLHRISDNRVSGTSRRNIAMFKELVGVEAYENVAVATTMWWNGEHELNLRKERELQEEHFKDILSNGGRMFKLTAGIGPEEAAAAAKEQAMEVIAHLMAKAREGPIVMKIQSEMVDEGLTLDKTAAGKAVDGNVEHARMEYEAQLQEVRREIADALRKQDSAAVRVAREMHRELDLKDHMIAQERAALQTSLLEMHINEEARMKDRFNQLELQWKEAAQKKEQELKIMEERLAELQRATAADGEARRRKAEEEEHQVELQSGQHQQDKDEDLSLRQAADAKWTARLAELKAEVEEHRQKESEQLAGAEWARRRQRREVKRIKKELAALQQDIAIKETAISKVKQGFSKGAMSGMVNGVASGIASAGEHVSENPSLKHDTDSSVLIVIPIVLGGMFCSVM